MFRYLALLWNPEATIACEAAAAKEVTLRRIWPGWPCALSIPGAVVYCEQLHCREGGTARLPDGSGVLLGIAFSKHDGSELTRETRPSHTLSILRSDELCATQGRQVVETIWGSYVLIFGCRNYSTRYILRSPAAALPCFHSQHGGVRIYFSDVNDFCAIHGKDLSINWPLIRAQAALGDHVTRETGIQEIQSVEGGECIMHFGSDVRHNIFWNPCKLASQAGIKSFQEAVASLRYETRRAVHTWASRYSSILVQLSGGLDSSIVLSCLASAPSRPRLHCVNFYAADCPGDERDFARSMAAEVSVPLSEVPRYPTCDLGVFMHCDRTARPALNFTGPGRFEALSELTRRQDCEVLFDGELGDNIFGWAVSGEPVADHIFRRGPFVQVPAIARDVARMKRISVWRVMTRAIRYSLSPSWPRTMFLFVNTVTGRDPDRLRFVTKEALDAYRNESERYIHPWFAEVAETAPGSVYLIYALLLTTSTDYHIPFTKFKTLNCIHPLVSQPLVECALRIPSAFAVRTGWNRAVARAAFSNELPTDVLQRTCKTTSSPWVTQTIRQHASWLRSFLLDGALAAQGILDRKRVEETLSERISPSTTVAAELFHHIYIEGWLRQWIT